MIRKGSIYTHTDLIRRRGWTKELIADALGEADVIQTFPRDPNRQPEFLYMRKRVEDLEHRDDVAAIVLPRMINIGEERRSAEAKKLIAAAAGAEIVVDKLAFLDLKIKAIEAYYERLAATGKHAPDRLDAAAMTKIYRRYAVGQLVDYERILAVLPAPISKSDVYALCRDRIDAAVYALYPQIAPSNEKIECSSNAAAT